MMFRRMRRTALIQGLILFLLIVAAMTAWMFIYQSLGGRSGVIFVIGVFAIFIMAFPYLQRIEKKVVCPACGKSLTDSEGWSVFIKECPHCGASYKRDR